MKSAFWRVFALALIVALVPSMAFAGGEVARSSMAGTNFMNTSADSWIFFHRTVDGGGMAELVTQGYDEDGDPYGAAFGRLTLPFGDYILGFEINDDATGSNLVDYSFNGSPYSRFFTISSWEDSFGPTGANAFRDGQMMTVKAAGAMGAGAGSVGVGIYNNTYDDTDGGEKFGSTGFALNASWGNGAPKTQGTIELAGEFTTHSNKYENSNDATQDEELSGNHFGANARYSVSDDSHLEAGFAFLSSDYDNSEASGGGTDTFGVMGFKLNYARDLVEESDRGAVVEVGFNYLNMSVEPDGAAEATSSSMAFPVCRFAAWHQITGKFRLFGGFAGAWSSNTDEDPDDVWFFDTDSNYKVDGSYWTTGIGWNPTDNLGLEFYVLTDNISSALALGSDTPLVGGVGAHASF